MSFVPRFNHLPMAEWMTRARAARVEKVHTILRKSRLGVEDFPELLSPAAADCLEALGRRSQQITLQRFGRVIRFFAPLYLSNECVNNCKYCGFSRDNPILRVTLTPQEVAEEGRALQEQGFRNILLVAGEHPKFVSNNYLRDCVAAVRSVAPGISLEVGPMEVDEYRPLVAAGAEGLVVYQETYDRSVYAEMHTAGPKKNFDWRLETPERAYAAGFRRLGLGALYGMSDWRLEALALAAHADYLLRHCWRAQITLSLPRLRPHAGEFTPPAPLSDRELVQLICAFRLVFPDVGLVLSTREPAALRDGLIPLGITHISAGSHTEPGGYTGAGRDNLHRTEKGRIIPLAAGETSQIADSARATSATGQFDIADTRTTSEVSAVVSRLGYEPVFKDWDAAFTA